MTHFSNPLDPQNVQLKSTLAQWLRAKFDTPLSAEVTFDEIKCAEPNCIHTETIIKIEGKDVTPLFFKISKPLVYIRRWDIDALHPLSMPPKTHMH